MKTIYAFLKGKYYGKYLVLSTLIIYGEYETTWRYTGCPRRKGPNFGRVFLRSDYTDITQNTYIQSSMVTQILNIEK